MTRLSSAIGRHPADNGADMPRHELPGFHGARRSMHVYWGLVSSKAIIWLRENRILYRYCDWS